MNERNVAALARLLAEKLVEVYGHDYRAEDDNAIAEWLASRGVLASNALTDEECAALRARAAMECIARGDE